VPAFYIIGSIVTFSSFLPFFLLLVSKARNNTAETGAKTELELEEEHLNGTCTDQPHDPSLIKGGNIA